MHGAGTGRASRKPLSSGLETSDCTLRSARRPADYQDKTLRNLSQGPSFTFASPSNRGGRWGTTDDFTTRFLHFFPLLPFFLFSIALWDLASSRPVHSLMMSSYLFLCLPRLPPPLTVPSKMVLARPDERETRPYHFSWRLLTMLRRSSCVFMPRTKIRPNLVGGSLFVNSTDTYKRVKITS